MLLRTKNPKAIKLLHNPNETFLIKSFQGTQTTFWNISSLLGMFVSTQKHGMVTCAQDFSCLDVMQVLFLVLIVMYFMERHLKDGMSSLCICILTCLLAFGPSGTILRSFYAVVLKRHRWCLFDANDHSNRIYWLAFYAKYVAMIKVLIGAKIISLSFN